MANREVVAVIPARGNSKGIPRKNLFPVIDKPLITYTVEAARSAKCITRIIVSTEDIQIARVAEALGAEVAHRPPALSEDHVHAIEPVLHAVAPLPDDTVVVMLLPTAPLRNCVDIDMAMKLFTSVNCDAVIAVCEAAPSARLRTIERNRLKPLQNLLNTNTQRQDDEMYYKVNGSIFIAEKVNLVTKRSFHLSSVAPFIMPASRSIDIDTLDDLTIAEALFK